MTKLIIGIIIGLALPFLTDWVLFGSVQPCTTTVTYEDGSSVQKCEVKQ